MSTFPIGRVRRVSASSTVLEQDWLADHLGSATSKVDPYWIEQLQQLNRPIAKSLLTQLVPDNALGFDFTNNGKTTTSNKTILRVGSFLDFTLQQKIKHPNKVILVRNGDFYETFGVDAIMLIAYAGLNPMGNKCKAGCPVKNVQQTLDSLTSAGLSVAVYEEIADIDIKATPTTAASSAKMKMKTRGLTQIVSPASSTYIYDLCLRNDDIEFRDNRPLVGIMKTIQGYLLCQVYLDEQSVSISERLTEEAIRTMLANTGVIDPIFVQDLSADLQHFLQEHQHHQIINMKSYDEKQFPTQVLQKISQLLEVNCENFRVVNQYEQATTSQQTRARPIYTSTALQVGLLPNDNVPNLIPYMLPRQDSHYAIAGRFLRKWLLHPPPHYIADHMQQLLAQLQSMPVSLPSFQAVSIGKVVSFIHAKQCNVALFRNVRHNANSLLDMLEDNAYEQMLPHLLAITAFECGIETHAKQLEASCAKVVQYIDDVIADEFSEDEFTSDAWGRIPDEFFRRNEEEFRNKISLQHPDLQQIYAQIDTAAKELCDVIQREIPEGMEIVHDLMDNALMIREKPTAAVAKIVKEEVSEEVQVEEGDVGSTPKKKKRVTTPKQFQAIEGVDYVPYIDRKGKAVGKRYTTDNLSKALNVYLSLTEAAPYQVSKILQQLSAQLQSELRGIIQSSHFAVVVQTTLAHTISARQKGWILPELRSFPSDDEATPSRLAMNVKGLTPYWISRDRAIANDIDLEGLFLLTAPNMSGKSTLMRSLLVLALLANCGFFVPAAVAEIPRFDTFFLRTASYDIPSEAKSAFALEMDDMRVIMRDCTSRSLVMMDELGKGTSARDGSALAGAILEYLDTKRVYGIFATHLHELFLLPLKLKHVQEKQMGYEMKSPSDVDIKWSYKLEDGRCTDSMALITAKQYQISDDVLMRAESLLQDFDAHCRPNHQDKTEEDISTNNKQTIESDSELPPAVTTSRKSRGKYYRLDSKT